MQASPRRPLLRVLFINSHTLCNRRSADRARSERSATVAASTKMFAWQEQYVCFQIEADFAQIFVVARRRAMSGSGRHAE